jgi:hypothetical protein
MPFTTDSPFRAFLDPGFERQLRRRLDEYPDIHLKLVQLDGNVFDLGTTVSVVVDLIDHARGMTVLDDLAGTVDSASNGLLHVSLTDANVQEIAAPATLEVVVKVTNLNGNKQAQNVNRPVIEVLSA